MGPTGIGKTTAAIQISKRFNGEIIGADSMQIYKYMDIGTAKPDPEELRQVPHHLVDFLDPKNDFDAGAFVRRADEAIHDIHSRDKIPVIAGGTGLYIRALINGLFRSETICEETLNTLNQLLQEKGNTYVWEKLNACDPQAADRIHPNDGFRVIRALEVFMTTGMKISDRQQDHNFEDNRYDTFKIALTMDRDALYDRINQRVDMMLEQGLLTEVQSLVDRGYDLDSKPFQSIGYRQIGMFLKKEVDWPEAVRLLKRDTRRYAKRQFTWFRKEKDVHWVEPETIENCYPLIKDFLT